MQAYVYLLFHDNVSQGIPKSVIFIQHDKRLACLVDATIIIMGDNLLQINKMVGKINY